MQVDNGASTEAIDALDPSEAPTTSSDDGRGYANIAVVVMCVMDAPDVKRGTVSSVLCNAGNSSVFQSVVYTFRASKSVTSVYTMQH